MNFRDIARLYWQGRFGHKKNARKFIQLRKMQCSLSKQHLTFKFLIIPCTTDCWEDVRLTTTLVGILNKTTKSNSLYFQYILQYIKLVILVLVLYNSSSFPAQKMQTVSSKCRYLGTDVLVVFFFQSRCPSISTEIPKWKQYSVSQKNPSPEFFCHFFPKRLGIFSPSFTRNYTFLSTLDYKFLFNYLQLGCHINPITHEKWTNSYKNFFNT